MDYLKKIRDKGVIMSVSLGHHKLSNKYMDKLRAEEKFELDDFKTKGRIVNLTLNDTSTGIEYSNKDLKKFRESNKSKIICVDGTSSFGGRFYDIRNADAWLFSVQKCFGLPPGLGVLVVNEKVLNLAKKNEKRGVDIGGHHSLTSFCSFDENNFTPSTPNILAILGFGFVCDSFKKIFGSLKELDKFQVSKSKEVYNFLKKISGVEVVCSNKSALSKTTIVVKGDKSRISELISICAEKGIRVAPGYGASKDVNLRIANFPRHNLSDFEKLFKVFK